MLFAIVGVQRRAAWALQAHRSPLMVDLRLCARWPPKGVRMGVLVVCGIYKQCVQDCETHKEVRNKQCRGGVLTSTLKPQHALYLPQSWHTLYRYNTNITLRNEYRNAAQDSSTLFRSTVAGFATTTRCFRVPYHYLGALVHAHYTTLQVITVQFCLVSEAC